MEIRYDSRVESKPIITDLAPPLAAPADVLDISSFVDYPSIFDALFKDGNLGWDGTGRAIHYGDLLGGINFSATGHEFDGKLSNGSVPPQWLVENGRHFLRAGTNGKKEPPGSGIGLGTCATCRIRDWQITRITPRAEYWWLTEQRFGKDVHDNQHDLGIKLPGMGGLAPHWEGLELGPPTPTGWDLQTYRYDREGSQTVDPIKFPIVPDTIYRFEGHVLANTKKANGVWNADGVVEFRVDGKPVWGRNNVLIFNDLQGADGLFKRFVYQEYHGGTMCPLGMMTFDLFRIAIGKSGWIGP